MGRFITSLFGEKNISNAAGVILALLDLGFDVQKIKDAIKDFAKVKRRFEFVYKKNETYLFDDYGHHPAEIAATIAATRARFKDRRIVVIFQPHTYSRTLSLKRNLQQVYRKVISVSSLLSFHQHAKMRRSSMFHLRTLKKRQEMDG